MDAPLHRPGRGQPSERCGDPPPARLRRGVEQFNRGEFFEQHETLELEWLAERDPVRYLYQGILQIGVGFEHLRRDNPHGARRLWRRGISYLEPFQGGCMSIDVDRLIADTERCLAELERGSLDAALIPRIAFLDNAADMSEAHIDLLRRVQQAFNERDIEAALDAFDPAAEWQQAREDPDATTLRGAEAIRRLWASWLDAYPDLRVEVAEVVPAGERVFVWVRITGRGAASGVEVAQEEAYVYTFRDGRIVRLEEYFDRREGLRAAGISE